MKKLLLFCPFFLMLNINAQSKEDQFKKLTELTSIAADNSDDVKKLDSVITQITLLKENAATPEVLQLSKEALKNIKELNLIKKSILPSNSFDALTKEDLKEFDYRYDKFDQRYYITPIKNGEIYPYIVLTKEGVYLRFVNIYEKPSWIFWNRARFLYDGKTFEYYDDDIYTNSSSSYNRYLGTSTTVTEKSDVFCTNEMIQFLRNISKANLVEGRLQGKDKSYDYIIGERTKLRIGKVLALYDKLKK